MSRAGRASDLGLPSTNGVLRASCSERRRVGLACSARVPSPTRAAQVARRPLS